MNLKTIVKATRALGFEQVALNALYRLGIKSGYFRWTKDEGQKTKDLRPSSFVLRLPKSVETDTAQLRALADEIVSGRYRQFGGEPVPIRLNPPGPLKHWSEHESHPHAGDIKLIWEPARFGWAFTLGRAYHATQDDAYAQSFWHYFDEFEAANPPNMGANWMSGQEVGLRLIAFAWADGVFAASPHSNAAHRSRLAVSIANHAARIPATLLYARSQNNNHLLTEAAALYTASFALPDHADSAHWSALGQKWLNWCFENQIDQTGEYIQHSSNYHRLMLQTALWVISIQSSVFSHQPDDLRPVAYDFLTPAALDNLRLATHWLLSMLDFESGGVPNLGANDGAYIFPLTNQPMADYRPVAQAAARAFLGLSLPPGPWDEMSLWLGLPESAVLDSYPGDHIYAENSWGMLRAHKYATRPSHPDQLHLDLWWRGCNVARDPGTFSYNAAPPWDNRLTSTLHHNTVSVDRHEQMTRASRFLYLDWAQARKRQVFDRREDFLHQFIAETDAYDAHGVHHHRTVSTYPDDKWVVRDTLENLDGRVHSARLHWLLADWEYNLQEIALTPGDLRHELRLHTPRGWMVVSVSAEVAPKEEDHHDHAPQVIAPESIAPYTLNIPASLPTRVSLVRAAQTLFGETDSDPTRGWFSPTYNVKEAALSLAVEVQSAESVLFTTTFTFPT
jgi:hypothetical protein